MSAKTNIDVTIGGKTYTLSGYENEAYLQMISDYLNDKIKELSKAGLYGRVGTDMKAVLLELNIADDYFKAKKTAEKLEEDLEARNKEIYDLKHDLIALQIQLENAASNAAAAREDRTF